MRPIIAVSLILFLCACGREEPEPVVSQQAEPVTDWRLLVQLPDVTLPVRLHLAADGSEAWLENGREIVTVPDVRQDGDNWRLRFPAFNTSLQLSRDGDQLSGSLTLTKRGYQQQMPVSAHPDTGYRFVEDPQATFEFTGRWEVVFVDDTGKETFAVGEFDQQAGRVTGTFLTATGDYRFLAGEVNGRVMQLSTLDGAHAFVFTAEALPDGSLAGDFWSGTRWHETWTARRNFDAKLPDAYSLTYLKPGYDRIEFTFPNLDGRQVSLDDARYRGKVVLVTLAGSWCPNCADEAEFLAGYYRDNAERGVEVITLLYEHDPDFEAAAVQGRAMKAKHAIDFEFLVAGSSDKALAAQTLPMLNHVMAYPTMIMIGRDGSVRKIHTGFNGPGTGEHYRLFVSEFNLLMDELLSEPVPQQAH